MKKRVISLIAVIFALTSLTVLNGSINVCALSNGLITPAAVSASASAAGKSDICVVCGEASALPYFCVEHIVIAAVLAVVLVLNFIKFKDTIIKMLANSAAVLLLIIVFSSQYTSEMFTQAKICLGVLALYLVLWVISVIKTVGHTEPQSNSGKRKRK